MPIDKSKLTNDMLEKAMRCQTADELIALVKAEGMEITKAEAFLDELDDIELSSEVLESVAGGASDCPYHHKNSNKSTY